MRQWLTKPGAQAVDLDASVFTSKVDMILWELTQIGGPEHNLERYAALVKALGVFMASISISEDDGFVKRAALAIGVEIYTEMMSFRDAAARDGKMVGPHDG